MTFEATLKKHLMMAASANISKIYFVEFEQVNVYLRKFNV